MTTQSAASARAFLRRSICPTHSTSVAEDAVLLTSEAVANAVRYGAPPIVLAVDCTGTALEVRVRDGSVTRPRITPLTELAEGGRGLHLIDLLSDAWGIDGEASAGKEVWFQLNAR
jgi:anti-sigma regulatory factor (Ser/Thr protein kinase)